MAESTLLHTGEEEPDVGKGHGTGALGPSDSSDSGSDVQGGPGLSLNEDTVLDGALSAGVDLGESHDTAGPDIGDSDLDSDTDASGTGERAAAGRDAMAPDGQDIAVDRVVEAEELGINDDHPDEVEQGVGESG
jgi:hypothetical protein